MALSPEFLKYFYEQYREEMERVFTSTVMYGSAWAKIFLDDKPNYEEEPVLFGFGQPQEKEINMLQVPSDFWSKLPAPTGVLDLEYAINDWKHARMFYAMTGPPRAYFEMPTGYNTVDGHEVTHRVIYTVMGFRKKLDPGETVEQAEPKLVAALWSQLIDVRRELEERYGDQDFVLFWRRGPELTDNSDMGSQPTVAKLSIRVAIPGADLQALVGDAKDGIDLPWLLTPEQAREERNKREIADARRKAEQAVQLYINKLSWAAPSHLATKAAIASQHTTAALRQLLDSAAMAQHAPRNVRLETRTHWVLAESRGLPNPMLERLGDLNSAAKSMVETDCPGANILNSSFSNRIVGDGVALISAAHPFGTGLGPDDAAAGQCQQQGVQQLVSKPKETLG